MKPSFLTHWREWIWAVQQLSTCTKHALKLNLSANKIQLQWWVTNEWLVERLHVVSLTSQWSDCLASQPRRLACWVLDGPQFGLIGLCGPTPLLFFPPHNRDLRPHWWHRMALACGWLCFKLGCLGTELRKRPELSGTLEECPHYGSQTQTQKHTHAHRRRCSISLCSTKHQCSLSHLKVMRANKFYWYSAPKYNVWAHKHALTFLTFCTSESL